MKDENRQDRGSHADKYTVLIPPLPRVHKDRQNRGIHADRYTILIPPLPRADVMKNQITLRQLQYERACAFKVQTIMVGRETPSLDDLVI